MRSNNSSSELTRIPLSICIVILLKKLSIMFSHDACVGVNTKTNLSSGSVVRYFLVSFDLWAE